MRVLFENVQVPGPDDLYCAVTVMLAPAVRPVRTDAADARCNTLPASSTEFTSTAATTVVAPTVTMYDIKHVVEPVELVIPAATEKSTFPVAGTVTVCVGPTVVRSP
jgi:hypothetical protein